MLYQLKVLPGSLINEKAMDTRIYQEFCRFYSINPYCLDADGCKQPLSADAQWEILKAFGLNADEKDPTQLIAELERRTWRQMVAPCLVVQGKTERISFHLKLPESALRNPIYWDICEENGKRHEGQCSFDACLITARHESLEEKYVAAKLQLPCDLPCGYHTISFRVISRDSQELNAASTIIRTPAKCYVPPGLQKEGMIWSIACQLGTLSSRRNWGIGDFSDLKNLLRWSSQHGAGAISINPLQAESSPATRKSYPQYFSTLRFLNPLYIDPEKIADFAESEAAGGFFNDPALKVRLASLRDRQCIDFTEVANVKEAIFEILWQHFQQNHLHPDTERGREFRTFQQQGGEELRAYALFETLREHFKDKSEAGWSSWPEKYRHAHADGLSQFAGNNIHRIEYHHYLQWQAERQLAAIGRRSMELGLKLGLLQTLPDSLIRDSFEAWYRPGLYACNMETGASAERLNITSLAGGKPLVAQKLVDWAYAPFISALRANMRHAGALFIPYELIAEKQCWRMLSDSCDDAIYLENPFSELLAIICLESQRNKCLVGCEYDEEFPEKFCTALRAKSILSYNPGHFKTVPGGDLLPPDQYPPQSAIAASNNRLTCLNGFWLGKDIELKSEILQGNVESWQEKQIIARAAARAHLLVALHRQKLLPEGYEMDPSTVSRLSADLIRAIHLFLAKTPAKILLLQMQDLPAFHEPGFFDEKTASIPAWMRKLPIVIESLEDDKQLHTLLRSICQERGLGVVRPSALLTDRKEKKTAQIPGSFYRLQLSGTFSFKQAAEVVPYLSRLGISHCYTSPFLAARPGSPHGYDIIDHSALNPEIGTRQEYEEFVAALDRHNMAHIIDMVPNHMGVGSDNKWWMDVLENGQASLYADYFDINWDPQQQELKGRVLLPILGDHYGSVLEGGQLRLGFNREKGVFFISYFEHCFPVGPSTYPFILGHDLQRLGAVIGDQHNAFLELKNLISSFGNLPNRRETQPEQVSTRRGNKEVLKRLLARLCSEMPEIERFIQENSIVFNGEKDRPESFDLLHELLTMQPYRLAFWRVASEEINYRRFFDINDLAGIRMENQRVFEETHQLVLDLIATGRVDGLRIDHPDGLYNPSLYYRRLQQAVSDEPATGKKRTFPLYVVVEKILADFEHVPPNWHVFGTTGYDFNVLVNGIFIDQAAEKELSQIYHGFIGRTIDFDELLYQCKKLIIKKSMAGELNVLADELSRLAKMNRYTQDYTLNSLREALIEIVAHFPVYRTYISPDTITKHDRNYIDWAIARACATRQAEDITVYAFLKSVMLPDIGPTIDETQRIAARDFVMKFQQYTGPIMAKGLEDTSFYIYNRLLSLNEVGGNPHNFGTSVSTFHNKNKERARHSPHGMLNTSTHDSKRSEDVRARINVLSEMTAEWQSSLELWSACNTQYRTKTDSGYAPSRNDEYALYQNLAGVWPFTPVDDQEGRALLTQRIENYMLKAIREAKVNTSWISQDADYEAAMVHFVRGILAEKSRFLNEFSAFQNKISRFGMFNSLSQLVLKLTSPGIPDTYQGSELWHLHLVDPDNREPVDFHQRERILSQLQEFTAVPCEELAGQVGQLLTSIEDGRVKLFILWKTLNFRREHRALFEKGSYIPLTTEGEKEKHICAFMRRLGETRLIVAVPRLPVQLLAEDHTRLPLGREVWGDTVLILPENQVSRTYSNILTGETVFTGGLDNNILASAKVFQNFPVCLLVHTSETGGNHD